MAVVNPNHFNRDTNVGEALLDLEERIENTEAGIVAAGSIGTAELADGVLAASVAGRAKMADGFFTEAKATLAFAAGAIVGTLLKAGALSADVAGRALMATGYFTEAKATDAFAAGAIATAPLKDQAVTKAKTLVFASTEQTGTGAPQNVAHGLGVVPAIVLVVPTEGDGNAFDILEGAHDATNVIVTTAATVKFKVLAWG